MSGPAKPRPAAVPSTDALRTLAQNVAEAQAQLARSIQQAGLQDDPLSYPLAALSVTIGLFPPLLGQMHHEAQRAAAPVHAAALAQVRKAMADEGVFQRRYMTRTAVGGLAAILVVGLICYNFGYNSALAYHQCLR